jgi:hypothetical protein
MPGRETGTCPLPRLRKPTPAEAITVATHLDPGRRRLSSHWVNPAKIGATPMDRNVATATPVRETEAKYSG